MPARQLFAALVIVTTIALAPPARSESLTAHCLQMTAAGYPSCRHYPSSSSSAAPTPARPITSADFAGIYSLYRLLSATDPHRGCRLQPTCSLFAAQAVRRFGLLRGLLMGLARAQMAHTDQGDFLPRAPASDGRFIYLDPVERWLPGEP